MIVATERSITEQAIDVLRSNRRRTKDGLTYTLPSADSYPYQWLWDSCFHAIALAASEPDVARSEIRALLSRQLPSGLLPHMIYWERVNGVYDIPWGYPETSSITQPPFIAEAVMRVYKATGDQAYLSETYPAILNYFLYLLQDRDPRGNHLIGIINPDESGEDDSPRFDKPLDLPARHTLPENFARRLMLVDHHRNCNFDAPFCTKKVFWVKDVPFNAVMIRNLKVLAEIAGILGENKEMENLLAHSSEIADAMRARMEEEGIWYSTMGESYEKIRVKSWAIFAPMYAGLLSKEEAEFLIENYLNNADEFATPFGVPTVPKSEKSYDPDGFWRGPVWMASNWVLYHAFSDYGYTDEAEKIRTDSLALLEKSGFRERFNPETGEGLGAHQFTWGALVLDMK